MCSRVRSSGYWLLVVALAAACGGNVEGGSRDAKDSAPSSEPKAPASNEDPGTDNPNANVELGDCTLGPAESGAMDAACAWVADDRCYQTRDMACNCACPRSRNSQCVSGFENGPDGHVWVACH